METDEEGTTSEDVQVAGAFALLVSIFLFAAAGFAKVALRISLALLALSVPMLLGLVFIDPTSLFAVTYYLGLILIGICTVLMFLAWRQTKRGSRVDGTLMTGAAGRSDSDTPLMSFPAKPRNLSWRILSSSFRASSGIHWRVSREYHGQVNPSPALLPACIKSNRRGVAQRKRTCFGSMGSGAWVCQTQPDWIKSGTFVLRFRLAVPVLIG